MNFPSKVTAVIFDKDGTLVDLDATWGKAMSNAVSEVSTDPEQERWLAELLGLNLSSQTFTPESLTPSLSAAQTAERISIAIDPQRFYSEVARQSHGNYTENFGATALLGKLHNAGIHLAIATNDSQAGAEKIAASFAWSQYFAAVAGADSGWGPKPGAAMLLGLCDKLGSATDEVLMVGDTQADLGAAKAAGIFYVQIGPLQRNDTSHSPDLQIEKLSEISDFLEIS